MKDFDELLDGVLQEDAAAQPRAGLEGRVMARIGTRRPGRNRFALWAGSLGCAAIAVVVIVISPRTKPASMPAPANMAARAIEGYAGLSNSDSRMNLHASPQVERPRRTHRQKAALLKRDVLPSPGPVGEFPAPVGVDDARTAARELSSAKAARALLDLRTEQAKPVRVAEIQIAPLVIDEDGFSNFR